MKKIMIGMAAMVLVVSVNSTTVFAAGGGRGRNFVDNNNDGVCDYYNTSCQFVDNDGDGICDNCGSNGCGNGTGYVDADGDGVCDNYDSNVCGNGSGYQNGSGSGRGHCGGQGRRGR